MLKIAIISHIPISSNVSGKQRGLVGITQLLYGKDTRIEVFSLSSRNFVIQNPTFVEHEIESPTYSKSKLLKLTDASLMVSIGVRPTIDLVNRNQEMESMVKKFNPDVIICGTFLLPYFLSHMKREIRKKIKIISIFDSQNIIYAYANLLLSRNKHIGPFISVPIAVLKSRYIDFNLKMYDHTLKVSDIHVALTQIDKREIEKSFKDRKARVVALSPIFLNKRKPAKIQKITEIKNILFIGNYLHEPNREAMEYIEKTIAPFLPDKKFLIAGSGCPKKNVGNVRYLGTVSKLESVLKNADLCIAPLTSGAGLKAKVLDYFNAGKAVIGTNIAFEGYEVSNNNNAIIEDDINKYADKIRMLEKDKKLFLKIQHNSVRITDKFAFPYLQKRWKNLIS